MFWEATPPEAPRLRRRPGPGLASQSRLCGRPDPVRPHDRQAGRDANRYDEFSTRAYRLRGRHDRAACAASGAAPGDGGRGGFSVYPEEWWHFRLQR
ncbi:hypothetical protein ACRAWD_10235 [Caulobacter segnis]